MSNLIDIDFAKACGIPLVRKSHPRRILGPDGEALIMSVCDQETAPLQLRLGDHVEEIILDVTKIANYHVVLGLPWHLLHNASIDYHSLAVSFTSAYCDENCNEPGRNPYNDHSSDAPCVLGKLYKPASSTIVGAISLCSSTIVPTSDSPPPRPGPYSLVPKKYHDYLDVFAEDAGTRLPKHRKGDLGIDLVPDSPIPPSKLYPLSEHELGVLSKYLKDNLNIGHIRISKSPFGAPILFVKKKDGTLRLCVDYRGLNNITIKNKYALPLIPEALDRLKTASVFTKFDIRVGYANIHMKEGDEYKTAFKTRYGLYEYCVMPFGLTNAPAAFQALMNEIFSEYLDLFVIIYLDDILIFSETPEEHETHVRLVLDKLRENDLPVKAEKCSFDATEVEYLGFIVGIDGVRMDESKVSSIQDWPEPRSLRDVQVFLGFANFYRRFIRNFSKLTSPLSNLIKKDTIWNFDTNAKEAFLSLKSAFTTAPIMAHFQPGVECRLETDASDFALAAVISQKDSEGKLHPLAFHSRKFSPAELNYDIHDKELLAVVEAFKRWRQYLEGDTVTLVYSDHKNLEYFTSAKILTRRQARWSEILAQYKFSIVHRPGAQQGKTDALSRRSDYQISSKASDAPPQILLPLARLAPIHVNSMTNEAFPTLTASILNTAHEDPRIQQILQDFNLEENLEKYDPDEWSLNDDGLLLWKSLIYVPNDNTIKLRILDECHDDGPSGHLGHEKTTAKVKRRFHFPGMNAYIQNYVNTCDICHRAKSLRAKQHGFLLPLPVAERPWSSISMDFIVKLPESAQGNDSIFVVVDRFSKLAYFVPFREEGGDATKIAELFLRYVFANHGLPKSIVSDRGSVFTSNFWQALMSLMHVRTDLSTSFHPQTDGQTERVNQTLEQYLRIYLNYEQNNWEQLLPLAQFCYNDATHSSTKITPFFANSGQHPLLNLSPLPHAPKRESPEALEFYHSLKETHTALREALEAVSVRMKRNYDRNVQAAPDFNVGDQVWLNARNIRSARVNKKLDHRYLGPFQITKRINEAAFRLALPAELGIHPTFHVSLLHRYVENEIPNRIQPPAPVTIVDGHEEHEIDSILDSQTYHGKLRYRVQFKGENASFREWVNAEDLHAEETVKKFHLEHPKAVSSASARQSSRRKGGDSQ